MVGGDWGSGVTADSELSGGVSGSGLEEGPGSLSLSSSSFSSSSISSLKSIRSGPSSENRMLFFNLDLEQEDFETLK